MIFKSYTKKDLFKLVNQKGYLDDQFSNDGLHLNEEGQNILAESINNVLKHIISFYNLRMDECCLWQTNS